MLGDNSLTLNPTCQEKVGAEANFAAGRLLFLRERFSEEARSLEPSIEVIGDLRYTFGNTLSTTLCRVFESFGADRPLVGMISGHPHLLILINKRGHLIIWGAFQILRLFSFQVDKLG